jgi:hypothetical protein
MDVERFNGILNLVRPAELPKYDLLTEKIVYPWANGFLNDEGLGTNSLNSRAHNTQIYGTPFVVFSARVAKKNALSLSQCEWSPAGCRSVEPGSSLDKVRLCLTASLTHQAFPPAQLATSFVAFVCCWLSS